MCNNALLCLICCVFFCCSTVTFHSFLCSLFLFSPCRQWASVSQPRRRCGQVQCRHSPGDGAGAQQEVCKLASVLILVVVGGTAAPTAAGQQNQIKTSPGIAKSTAAIRTQLKLDAIAQHDVDRGATESPGFCRSWAIRQTHNSLLFWPL